MGSSNTKLPDGLLVAWYGDDFTGSAAVAEVLSFAGLPSVLFLDIPTPEQLARFPGMRGIGIAGTARSHSPDWMQENLPQRFEYLKSLKAPISHYKTCSTLDSSPEIGSIGKAIELAQSVFHSKWVPVLHAAPAIRRYQCFGHLFAAAPDGVFRLDRHPVMAHHPVTPMDESDVARHLAKQTCLPIGLVDLEMLSDLQGLSQQAQDFSTLMSLDTVSQADLTAVGQLIWQERGAGLFAVGSQGVEYALVNHWQRTGAITRDMAPPKTAGKAGNIIVVSGSVSHVTERQIDWALQNGFGAVHLDAVEILAGSKRCEKAISTAVEDALKVLNSGKDPIVFTAKGPDDPQIARFHQAVAQSDATTDAANNAIGAALGQVLKLLLRRSDVRRAVVSGGDTSGHATRELDIFALTAIAPTIPGATLFQAHSDDVGFDDLQLALKGGQMGTDDYFGWIKHGGGAAQQGE